MFDKTLPHFIKYYEDLDLEGLYDQISNKGHLPSPSLKSPLLDLTNIHVYILFFCGCAYIEGSNLCEHSQLCKNAIHIITSIIRDTDLLS